MGTVTENQLDAEVESRLRAAAESGAADLLPELREHIYLSLRRDLLTAREKGVTGAPRETQARITKRLSWFHRNTVRTLDTLVEIEDEAGERSAMADIVGPFWPGSRVREALHLKSRQALAERVKSGSVLALPVIENSGKTTLVYPVSQFRRLGEEIEVRPELVAMLRVLREHDPWSVALVLAAPAEELGDVSPIEAAKPGPDRPAVEEFAALARTIHREWTAP